MKKLEQATESKEEDKEPIEVNSTQTQSNATEIHKAEVKEEKPKIASKKVHQNSTEHQKEAKKLPKEDIEPAINETVVRLAKKKEPVPMVDCETQTIENGIFTDYIKLKRELDITRRLKTYVKVI